jgi:hypothetical protein
MRPLRPLGKRCSNNSRAQTAKPTQVLGTDARRVSCGYARKGAFMLGTVLLIILILLLIGALPRWGYSSGWGYYPTGGIGLVLLIVIILLLLGYV